MAITVTDLKEWVVEFSYEIDLWANNKEISQTSE